MINAGFHFLVAFFLSRYEIVHRSVIFLPSALILVFITIAIPVQLKGNWVTLAWAAQAVVLFSLGRIKQISLYEYFSYPLMILASLSLLNDWQVNSYKYFYNDSVRYPIFNVGFLTTILFAGAFALIYYTDRNEKYESSITPNLRKITGFAIPTICLVALYKAFRIEISNYFQYELARTTVPASGLLGRTIDSNLELFSIVWQINYTILFLSFLALANIKKLKSPTLGFINLSLNAAILFIFLTIGLFELSLLRESYLLQTSANVFQYGINNILVRYISLFFVGELIFVTYQYCKQEFIRRYIAEKHLNYSFDFLLYFTLWVILSSELINLMDISGLNDSYKLGLSILWGVYSLCLIVLGITQSKKHLRIGAILLFTLTLLKLFFYDIVELNTISKTVVFISLGILLLITSFLYNKYKNLIFETNEV
jgi:uncharacterized membrane protein